jgi:hypothetical protein
LFFDFEVLFETSPSENKADVENRAEVSFEWVSEEDALDPDFEDIYIILFYILIWIFFKSFFFVVKFFFF